MSTRSGHGVVLSGGGVYGVMLLGALHAKLEAPLMNGEVKLFAGTSSGALVATLLGVGYSCLEIVEAIKRNVPIIQTDSIRLSNLFERYGLFTNVKMLSLVKAMLSAKTHQESLTFGELYDRFQVELIIVGTNLTQQKAVYFQRRDYPNMNIIDALEITCCIPLVFPFVLYENEIHIDGMLVDNFPTAYAHAYAKQLLNLDIELHGFTITYERTIKPTSLFAYIECLARFVIHMLHKTQCSSSNDIHIHALNTARSVTLTTDNPQDIEVLFQDGVINILKNHSSIIG